MEYTIFSDIWEIINPSRIQLSTGVYTISGAYLLINSSRISHKLVLEREFLIEAKSIYL